MSVSLLLGLAGCAQERDREQTLALIDSVLTELGGESVGYINRTQRWRMISSMGPGLPPPNFSVEDLPPTESRGAALLQAHCQSCHWVPSPRMHSAQEWPILLRRMLMRGHFLDERMGGPLTVELLGSEMLMEGMRWSYLPSKEDADSLLAYLQANALPVADPEDLGSGPETELFVELCSRCHEIPSPMAHTPAEWKEVIGRMLAIMPQMGIQPLTEDETRRVISYLETRSSRD